MKTIGLIGGTTWLSTAEYYRLLNQRINQTLGGAHYAQCILYSFDYADIKTINEAHDWASMRDLVTTVSKKLIAAGADCILLCANTMHIVAEELRQNIPVPVIHIAEATAVSINRQGLDTVGLLGTKFTMEKDFFKKKLLDRGIKAVIPAEADREFIHASIFEELGKEIFREETKRRYITIIDELALKGAQGIILGCTEIPLLIKQADCNLPLFDTVSIHVDAAIQFALKK
jgi:aspartate racemase